MNRWKQAGAAGGAVVLLAALHGGAAAQGAGCPESGYRGSVHTVTPGGSPDLVVEARGLAAAIAVSVRDTTSDEPDVEFDRFVRHLDFALQQGAFGFGFAPGAAYQCHAGAVVDERFRLEGLPEGTDLALPVRLDLEVRADRAACASDCAISVVTRIVSPAGADERQREVQGPAGPSVNAWSYELLVPVRAGEEFALRFAVSHGAADHLRSVATSARWSFPGLAPGVTVSSCLASAGPTPVRAATWGGLKAHYR